ncbi:hypothetical protein ACOSQ2_010747 [Xanthoceras sorbifolium]
MLGTYYCWVMHITYIGSTLLVHRRLHAHLHISDLLSWCTVGFLCTCTHWIISHQILSAPKFLAPVLPAPSPSLIFFAHYHCHLHRFSLSIPTPPKTPSSNTCQSLTRASSCCRPASFYRPISPIVGDSFLTANVVALVGRRASPIWSSCYQLSTSVPPPDSAVTLIWLFYIIATSISLHYFGYSIISLFWLFFLI